MRQFSTPMMRQYAEIKSQYADCLLFFRLGDFYELFLDDAIVGAAALDITLTKRPRGKDGHIPMAGVPYHAADNYIARLVKAGHKVAICEQVSEPGAGGIVDREVVRIITPGTILDNKSLTGKRHNYTMALSVTASHIGIAVCDISTGDFKASQVPYQDNFDQVLGHELARFDIAECILSETSYADTSLLRLLSVTHNINTYGFADWKRYGNDAEHVVKKHFGVKTLAGFGLKDAPEAVRAAAALLGYLAHTQKDRISHITSLSSYQTDQYVRLDRSTITNLELFHTLREQEHKGSLLSVLDHSHTAMGGRLLRTWLRTPLQDQAAIGARLDAVESLLSDRPLQQQLTDILTPLTDIERTLSRLSVGIGSARDLVALRQALAQAMLTAEALAGSRNRLIKSLCKALPANISDLVDYLNQHIVDEPPLDIKSGNLIKTGINKKLDRLRKTAQGGKDWIAEFEAAQRQATGISTLKVRFNNVFGYYIEVSKANLDLVPAHYQRKQTMVNAERFITPELKAQEEHVLTAQDQANVLEQQLFVSIVDHTLSHTSDIQSVAQAIATIDCLLSFATIAQKNHYCKPTLTTDGTITITAGRHPVVETLLYDEPFVPNDVLLDHHNHQLLVITGPNMAGKSVYIRQVAVAVLLAHIGCFVPAESASISLVDSIFVRSGASDVITGGLSTFMVEMVETAHILNHATDKSLVIMDEIGRGTSTYDGISIAWAVAEHLVGQQAKTLFATHYHELQELEQHYPGQIKNYHAHTELVDGKPQFLHTILEGGAGRSHGIAVAKLAGVPEEVTKKAEVMLKELEEKS